MRIKYRKLCIFLAAIFVVPSLAIATSKKTIHTTAINEIVMFKTKPHYTSKQIIKLANEVASILKTYPGFILRGLSEDVNDPHQWIDIVQWASLKDALLAAKKIIKTLEMKKFVAAMQSYRMYHFGVKTTIFAKLTIKSGVHSKINKNN